MTPRKAPIAERLRVFWSEVWTYQRGMIIASAATAALALGVGGPIIYNWAAQRARAEILVRSVGADNPRLVPVVMQTDDGKTMVLFVEHAGDDDSKTPAALPAAGEVKGGEL